MNSIVLDIGGTNIKMGLILEDRLHRETMIDALSEQGFLTRLPIIENHIIELVKSEGLKIDDFAGIGIAIPGLIDFYQNRMLSVNVKYSDAIGFDFNGWAKEKFGIPLTMENDARAALVGEWQYGAGKGSDNLAIMTIGTGIGTSVIVEGKLLRGKHFQAGCLGGHFTVNLNGINCNCGNIGCVESEASTWSLPIHIKAHPAYTSSFLKDVEKLDFKTLYQKDLKDDPVVKDIKEHCFKAWTAGLVSLIHAYDPELIVLSGGPMKDAEEIIPELQSRINHLAWTPWGKVELRKATHINTAALFGMHYLVIKERLK